LLEKASRGFTQMNPDFEETASLVWFVFSDPRFYPRKSAADFCCWKI